ncbi:hypothetical protein SmJEL517_g05831 [Synchytrium microbalum]|uniref:Uncharacterized protein n=1 Tax=Synchytrium microbalum TaxID=1806994 RepID=A0A507BLS6_9FUNG|nr:uncharacterized protein SmJEL517_g05831 [Synchytrium microbalum]TPX30647.1 hypothetical protein SmJEL517_g05831 [Synchytrium microbalum]
MLSSLLESIHVGYRSTVFAAIGLREYTKSGFERASLSFTPGALDKDLKEKTIIVTGANSGLGFSTAKEFAQRGANVLMLCRNPQAGAKAKDEIVKETGNQHVQVAICDVSLLHSVKSFADSFVAEHKPLHVLVNNAGAMSTKRELTSEGIETSFALNSLGTYFLTRLLTPVLESTDDARVVTVSSAGMYNKALDADDLEFEKLNPYDGVMSYAQDKRRQVEMTNRWAEEQTTKYGSGKERVLFYTMHPCWTETPGVEKSLPGFYNALKNSLRTPQQGCDTTIWASISDEVRVKAQPGSFLQDRAPARQHLIGAGTQTTKQEVDKFIEKCDAIIEKVLGPGAKTW